MKKDEASRRTCEGGGEGAGVGLELVPSLGEKRPPQPYRCLSKTWQAGRWRGAVEHAQSDG